MQFGIAATFGGSPKRDIGFLKEFAVACEEVGFDALYAPEHVVFFASYDSKYPYTPDGSPNWGPDTGLYDPLFVCAVAGMVTTRLRLATSVLILPERPALLTAKEVMTLDHICGGRFDLGVGIGWSDEEYAALGVPWERRGRRADEYIEAIRTAWRDDRAAYHGEFVDFDNAVLRPAPLGGTVPVIVDFWAPWCGPCKLVAPELEKLAAQYDGKVDIVKVNVDENPALQQAFNIMSIPTIAYFKGAGAQPVGAVGFQTAEQLESRFALKELA